MVIVARRFGSVAEASDFGHKLQASLSVAGSLRGTPIDVGADNSPTTKTSSFVKDIVLQNTGNFIRNDIHGLDVYPDYINTFIFGMNATLSVSITPESLFTLAETVATNIEKINNDIETASYLINAAAISNHPVAVAALNISAIELLAQNQKRSPAQKAWIKGIRHSLQSDQSVAEAEKADLMKAVEGMFKVSVADSTRALLISLKLDEIESRWKRLYADRSILFHGVRRMTQQEIITLGSEASELCRLIFSRLVQRRIGVLQI